MKLVTTLVAAVALATLALLPLDTASAIQGGTPDGNRHPSVGLVLLDGRPFCSGTLYRTSSTQTTSNLFMTAGHCAHSNRAGRPGTLTVTFDAIPGPSSVIYTGTAYAHPDFEFSVENNSLNQFRTPDVGVIVLDRQVTGITPADLPAVGVVGTLNPKTQKFEVVGYGLEGFTNANTPVGGGKRNYRVAMAVPGQRNKIEGEFLKLTEAICYGDSGGPTFIGTSRVIAGVNSWGQSTVCSGSNGYAFRIDNTSVLNFLRNPATVGVRR